MHVHVPSSVHPTRAVSAWVCVFLVFTDFGLVLYVWVSGLSFFGFLTLIIVFTAGVHVARVCALRVRNGV